MGDDDEDISYQTLANNLKDEGNSFFQKGDKASILEAIRCYSEAIGIDPDNCVFYSNRSAAYMKADSKSKALWDAEKCVALDPNFIKGYNRLGVAQQSLNRYYDAMETMKKGIEKDPANKSLWSALRSCQDAHEAHKKMKKAEDEMARRVEEEKAAARSRFLKKTPANTASTSTSVAAPAPSAAEEQTALDSLFANIAEAAPSTSRAATTTTALEATTAATTATETTPASEPVEDDLLSFFQDVETTTTAQQAALLKAIPKDEQTILTPKYTEQDLGNGKEQYARLTATNYEFKNLNPYYVLQLGVDATQEDIKHRYRKLSAKVHPDKLRDMENSREAFEQVKAAYLKLGDEREKKAILMNIDFVETESIKDRKKLLSKGVVESTLPPLAEEIRLRTLKHFADIEMQRRRSEKNKRLYSAREKMQETDEQELQATFMANEKVWSQGERRDKRIDNWRDFGSNPESKKVKAASYKEETRVNDKHGTVKLEEWKRSWK